MSDIEKIQKLENWTKENDWNGHFRYVVGAKCAYEIFIEYWRIDTPIETAKASLCLTGMWNNKNSGSSVEREWLGKELPICELLNIAMQDYIENMG